MLTRLHDAWTRTPASIRLAIFWLAAAPGLAAWGVAATRGPVTTLGPTVNQVTLFAARPPGHVISFWLRWDAAPGHNGWIVLESARPRSDSEAMSWRRRVHPGWTRLVWDVAALPAGEPVRIVFDGGHVAPWAIVAPRADAGYGLHHATILRGLALAMAVALLVPAARVVGSMVTLVMAALRVVSCRAEVPPVALGTVRWCTAVALIAAAALWLRVHTVASQSLWCDEVLTAIGAQDLAWVVHTPQIFGHPPLQYVAAWAAGGSTADEWWLRFPSSSPAPPRSLLRHGSGACCSIRRPASRPRSR